MALFGLTCLKIATAQIDGCEIYLNPEEIMFADLIFAEPFYVFLLKIAKINSAKSRKIEVTVMINSATSYFFKNVYCINL